MTRPAERTSTVAASAAGWVALVVTALGAARRCLLCSAWTPPEKIKHQLCPACRVVVPRPEATP